MDRRSAIRPEQPAYEQQRPRMRPGCERGSSTGFSGRAVPLFGWHKTAGRDPLEIDITTGHDAEVETPSTRQGPSVRSGCRDQAAAALQRRRPTGQELFTRPQISFTKRREQDAHPVLGRVLGEIEPGK